MNIETLIRDANPVAANDLPAADSPAARRSLGQILEGLTPAARPRRRPTRRVAGLALAGVAAVAAAAVVIASLPGSPSPGSAGSTGPAGTTGPAGHPSSVAAALQSLAVVASTQPASHPPRPGQFWYTSSRSLNEADTVGQQYFAVNYQQQRQIWIGADGSGRIVSTSRHPTFPTPKDRAGWIADGRPSLRVAPADDKFGPHGLSESTEVGKTNLWTLTTDPVKLAALISARKIEGGPPGPAEDYTQVADMLRETDTPSALRAALFRVAAHIPGVRLLGTIKGHAATAGIGIAYVSRLPKNVYGGDIRKMEMIFDPRTSALLAEQVVLVDPHTHHSTVSSWTAYLGQGLVNSATSIPTDGTAS
jgi:hypothetical protein